MCMRACVRVCVRACVYVCVCVRVCVARAQKKCVHEIGLDLTEVRETEVHTLPRYNCRLFSSLFVKYCHVVRK